MEAILFVGIIQSLLGSILIFTFRKKHLANRILSYWLIVILAIMVEALIKQYNHIYFQNAIQSSSVLFIFGPMLFLYSRSLIVENPKITFRDIYHFIPFLLFTLVLLIIKKEGPLTTGSWFMPGPFFIVRLLFTTALILSLVIYSTLVLVNLRSHFRNIKNHFSYNSERINLAWLALIAMFFILGYLTTLVVMVIRTYHNQHDESALTIYYSVLTLFSYGVSLFGYRQPILYGHQARQEIMGDDPEPRTISKYEKSGLKSPDAENYLSVLIEYMENEKPYLQGDLALQDISADLGIPKHYITQIINERLGKNFYNFVNEYRVNELKKRLSDPKNDHLTLLGIAMDCGFNSKSSFNAIFKQITGKTPTEYKKESVNG
jgi:AraC-like DNA-binding protein